MVPNIFRREGSSQFIKICIVGGISTIFNYLLFYVLFQIGIHYLISSASGYIFGAFISFTVNKHFTFKSRSKKYAVEVTKYFFIYTVSLFLGLGFLQGLVYIGISPLLANVFSIGLTTMTNFAGSKFFVFEKFPYRKKIDFYTI